MKFLTEFIRSRKLGWYPKVLSILYFGFAKKNCRLVTSLWFWLGSVCYLESKKKKKKNLFVIMQVNQLGCNFLCLVCWLRACRYVDFLVDGLVLVLVTIIFGSFVLLKSWVVNIDFGRFELWFLVVVWKNLFSWRIHRAYW
jgi:hypothetical protein